ncbi:hypothetical protein B0H19DRAFT_1272237 [Mycena capillaripes]|nr:hypothetical protein B0H19DRAFT_1272237 [Mycena capillaripes]
MLFLLLLVHTLSASGRPIPSHHPDSRATAESCDDINNCRKLFDIVWGCLATIFAATWVSVHPNVPPPDQSWLALFWRRLRMMLVAIIAPELMVGFAVRQFFTAWWYSKEYNISKTHGFFISMGGFVSRTGHHPITTPEQLQDITIYLTAVDTEDIKDKSKGDTFSKGVAFLQGLWFITQCLARVRQNLPITELEVATLAFSVVNLLIWALWWNKPLDVERPILVGLQESSEMPNNVPLDNQVASLLRGKINLLKGDAKLWQAGFWDRITGALTGAYSDFEPTLYNSVPSFWSSGDSEQDNDPYPFVIECLVGTVFGAIHCAAWNADFPSIQEMWMWRSCSVLVATVPVIFLLALLVVAATDGLDYRLTVAVLILTPIYIIARLFLIVLPFVALRAPLPDMLMDVDWSVYIPHL